jgi:hypothetical protein
VVTFSALRLRVKTLDVEVSVPTTRCIVILLGLLSWSSDFVRFHFAVFGGKFWFSCTFLFIFDPLCKRISSSPCIGLVIVALFIQRGESQFRRHMITHEGAVVHKSQLEMLEGLRLRSGVGRKACKFVIISFTSTSIISYVYT